ncbi:MAG: short-chain dehydrogenase [Betaproteobacteria bacterium SG8_40]|nr:MAG: short-chain dehydrogenase [Betaproteobacteria bacterium SG8_40]
MNGKFLDGKTAVVTGGSRGLGRAMALALGGAGARLALVGRDQEKLAETQALAKDAGVESEIYICDVREESQVSKLEQEVKQRFGNVHILINNAGTAVRKNLVDFSMDEWRTVIDTNLTGVFLASRAFVPHMRANKWGRIINITSIMARVGSAGRAAYCATKSGVLAITKSMALEHVGEGINVVAISPGFYATDLTAPLRADAEKNAGIMDAVPAHRWGEPKEIGDIALFLCSDGASFITGTDILSDGGWVAQ